MTSAIRAAIQKHIAENNVMIFSKSYCPYCRRAKELFGGMSAPFQAIELDQLPDGASIQQELAAMTGQTTVPNIFIKGKHVGGCDAVTKLHESGQLTPML